MNLADIILGVIIQRLIEPFISPLIELFKGLIIKPIVELINSLASQKISVVVSQPSNFSPHPIVENVPLPLLLAILILFFAAIFFIVNIKTNSGTNRKRTFINTNSFRPLRIFLCHSSLDKINVRKLYSQLKSIGFKPWLDEEEILPGQDWSLEIAKAIRSSEIILVFLSNNSISQSGYMQRELKSALDLALEQPEGKIFIIPIRLEDCNVPENLKKFHWLNLFESNSYKKLILTLTKIALET